MFRQLAPFVLLSLVAVGIMPAQADTDEVYTIESPPVIEFGELTPSGSSSRSDVLQPTFPVGETRSFYDLDVDVMTTGELDNFNVVSACLFTSSEASRAEDRDDLCGYSASAPTSPPNNPDPSIVLSMAWVTAGTFRIDGDTSHALGDSTHETLATTRTINSASITYNVHRLKFQFALSHSAINTSDWTVRVVAVSTPTLEDGSKGEPQRTELLLDTACSTSYVAQVEGESEGVACGTPDSYGVTYYGGFSTSTVRSVDYGPIYENSSSLVRTISPTASYYSNDLATLTIAASDFESGDDTIPLLSDEGTSIGDEQNKKTIVLECNAADGVGQKFLDADVIDFFVGLPRSSAEGNGDDARNAPNHTCQLHYGIGAANPNSVYRNVVEVGIKDGNTDAGPTVNAVEIEPSP